MRFFNSKEEVLDVQLTKYGRHSLSQGLWKPAYYAFFDDGIIYDYSHAGVTTEAKNDIEGRIQEETPYFRTQANFTGRDEFLYDGINDIEDRVRLGVYEKLTVLPLSLGSTTLDSEKTPAYKIRFIDGEIKNLEYNITGAARTTNVAAGATTNTSQQLIEIPQIDLDIEFKISAEARGTEPKFEVDPALTPSVTYEDGSSVYVGPDQLIFVIEEENATFDHENFDIEVYEIKGGVGNLGEPVLEPLSFVKPVQNVVDNRMIDQRDAEILAGRINGKPPELDPTYVEYFFNINVDNEIDQNVICKSLSSLKSSNFFNDLDLNCPDLHDVYNTDIYGTDTLPDNCPDY